LDYQFQLIKCKHVANGTENNEHFYVIKMKTAAECAQILGCSADKFLNNVRNNGIGQF